VSTFDPITTDCSLVRRIADGDSQAERQLYQRHSVSLYALAYGMLWDPDDADRVVSETFDHARRDSGEFDPSTGTTFSWLTRIARACVHRRRRGSLAGPRVAAANAAAPLGG
jgi:DNA-directed RNA polymerase specialized sigma24 family protein